MDETRVLYSVKEARKSKMNIVCNSHTCIRNLEKWCRWASRQGGNTDMEKAPVDTVGLGEETAG